MSYNTILATTPLTSTGYHLKATGTTIGNSLIWDNGTNVGIGNTNTSYTLDVSGTGRFTGQLHIPNNSTGTNAGLFFDYNANAASRTWCIVSDFDAYGDFQIRQSTTQTGTTFAKILGFSSTGAATFSSSVTAGQGTFQSTGANIISKNTTTSQSNFIRYDNSLGAARAYLGYETTGTDFYVENVEGKLLLAASSGTAMTISGLNVGIGTSSPSTAGGGYTGLDIRGSGGASLVLGSTGTLYSYIYADSGALTIQTTNSLPITFLPNGTERMRITSGGDVLFQKTSSSPSSGVGGAYIYSAASPFFSVVGNGAYIYCFNQDAGAYRFFVSGAGQINATSTSITAISDISLKENIRDLETGLSEILRLKPRRFDWKEETKIGEKNVAGFIAQELESVLPELVYEYQYNDKETKKSIKMGDILPTLVKAIQEMNTKLDAQNQTIQSLQEQINILAK